MAALSFNPNYNNIVKSQQQTLTKYEKEIKTRLPKARKELKMELNKL